MQQKIAEVQICAKFIYAKSPLHFHLIGSILSNTKSLYVVKIEVG